jgi:hypothetical protein
MKELLIRNSFQTKKKENGFEEKGRFGYIVEFL